MSQATERREGEGVGSDRAQRKLTNSVGARLAPRSKPSNSRWSTLRRLGIRARPEA